MAYSRRGIDVSEFPTTSAKNMSLVNYVVGHPLDRRRTIIRLVGGGLVLALGLSVVGWGIVKLLTSSALTRWEDSVNLWFFDHRNPTLNFVSHIGSYLAGTVTYVAILLVLFFVFRWWLGRWRESFVLLAAIVGELLVFLIVTAVVNRPRSGVPHLDVAPPTSSFSSGHTAAAVALYGCIAVIIVRNLRLRWLAITIATVCCVVPFVVGASRLYRGMHHPTDVLFGTVGGGLWLLLVLLTLLPRPAAEQRSSQASAAAVVVNRSELA
jgi:membrane-associated phospholipid phosphatase